jgi:hypothetical protein
MGRSIKFDIGGMWEFAEWEVLLNQECQEGFGVRPCKHCFGHTVEIVPRFGDGTAFTRFKWICPRIIYAKNEGGYNSTGVCLDCVLDEFR